MENIIHFLGALNFFLPSLPVVFLISPVPNLKCISQGPCLEQSKVEEKKNDGNNHFIL